MHVVCGGRCRIKAIKHTRSPQGTNITSETRTDRFTAAARDVHGSATPPAVATRPYVRVESLGKPVSSLARGRPRPVGADALDESATARRATAVIKPILPTARRRRAPLANPCPFKSGWKSDGWASAPADPHRCPRTTPDPRDRYGGSNSRRQRGGQPHAAGAPAAGAVGGAARAGRPRLRPQAVRRPAAGDRRARRGCGAAAAPVAGRVRGVPGALLRGGRVRPLGR
jgi:hypothetical protein